MKALQKIAVPYIASGGYEVLGDNLPVDCFDSEEHELFADSTDWALRLGNTFNLSGMVRKIRPPDRGNLYLGRRRARRVMPAA